MTTSWLKTLFESPGATEDGEVRLIFPAVDWDATSLGPPATWPQSLRTTLEIMMSSRYPMCAAWGEDLTFFYNDAYAPFLGARHPEAMGMSFKSVWSEIWDDLAPLIDSAMAGRATWSQDIHLVMTRNGYEEDTWWTFSYSPLRDDRGAVVGFLDVCSDSTAKVLNDRDLLQERERLRESEAHFRALVNASSDVVYRVSADWQEMRQLDGRGLVADLSTPSVRWMELYVPEDERAAVEATIAQAVETGGDFELEHRVLQTDGSIGWILSRAIAVRDADGRIVEWFGMATDVTARRRTDDHLRLVVNELNHRVKNNLAMVQSIAMQTFRKAEDAEQASARFAARLVALARANDLLTGERWTGVDLGGVLAEAVASHNETPERLRMDGPTVQVSAKSALALTLAAHELATNAVKYGAWSNGDGVVDIRWRAEPDGRGQRLSVEWREIGGPTVTTPTRRGFGSRLIERGLAAELGGKVELVFDPAGLICRIEAVVGVDEEGEG